MNIQTVTTTISSANQTAVPSYVRKSLNLKAGDRITWRVDKNSKKADITVLPQNWGTYMRGLGKEIWEGVDTDNYIKELRRGRKTR